MFINALPQRYCVSVSDAYRRVEIPTWIRAPLSLSSRQHAYFFWSVANSRVPNVYSARRESFELVFTPFHPSDWEDMWRLEVQYYDRHGLMDHLFHLLDGLNIKVIDEDSRNAFIPEYHLKGLLLDCKNYNSDLDPKTNKNAFGAERSALDGLRQRILTEFIEYIRISNNGTPRLTIERNFAYENLASVRKPVGREIDTAKCQLTKDEETGAVYVDLPRNLPVLRMYDGDLTSPAGVEVSRRQERDFWSELKTTSYINFAVNSRGKIGYCRVIPKEAFKTHFHFIFYSRRREHFPRVVKAFSDNEYNILRSQICVGRLGHSWLKENSFKNALFVGGRDDDATVDDVVNRWGGDVHTLNIFAETRVTSTLASVLGSVQNSLSTMLEDRLDSCEVTGFAYDGNALAKGRKLGKPPSLAAEVPPSNLAGVTGTHEQERKRLEDWKPLCQEVFRKARRLRDLRRRQQDEDAGLAVDLEPYERQAIESLSERERILWNIRRDLLMKKNERPSNASAKAPRVFVSYGFGKPWSNAIRDISQKVAGELAVSVDTGVHDDSDGTNQLQILDTVRDRILAADFFIVVFTPDDKDSSAWLSTELGVAIGAKKPFAVIAHQEVPPERSFRPVNYKYCFRGSPSVPFESNLEEFLRKAMTELELSLIDSKFSA